MPLPKDPETLRIPAFMRKRNLRVRARRPLILTALDRKNAGLPPEGLRKKKKKSIYNRRRSEPAPLPPFRSVRPRRARKPKANAFSAPLLDFYPERLEPKVEMASTETRKKHIGEITHYYDKIQVGVIKLKGVLAVGNCILYETFDGEMYEQVVESMEIDREPVFKAGRGKEIGLKLRRIPRINGDVNIVVC